MASDHPRNRGSLFNNADKRKPSQPDLRGECTLEGVSYTMQAWERDDQLTLTLAPARRDTNAYPPDAFRGALDHPSGGARRSKDGEPAPVWEGTITGEDASYSVRAIQKQGKSGPYLTLMFERVERVEQVEPPAD